MIEITPATPDDAPQVYQIMRAAFAEYIGVLNPPSGVDLETVEDVRRAIEEGGAVLAWFEDKAVGSARYVFHDEGRTCYVGRVSVLPEARGKGIASAMVSYIESVARDHGDKSMEIIVRLILENNVHLYQHLGYHIAQTWEHPQGGALVATMVKSL
ncbi:MAG: GNAT family N-acetyltransferase [Chloroflexi bacterium]|nr:GNAT family N-acetyltransferase [Chloroflexota bacterium]